MSKFSFGIDLGTTNSCIAVMQGATADARRPQVLKLSDGRYTLPSCVWYKRDGSIVVGREAYEHRYLTDEVVYSSKRFIGTDHVYELHDGALKVTPVDVAAEVLKSLKHDAEIMYGEGAVDEAVITVPAYFDSNKRRATKLAAEKAGIIARSIINEPTAAALAYTLGKNTDEQFLVYDLGGGTFDVTMMDIRHSDAEFDFFGEMAEEEDQDTLAQVMASAGDDHLGGDDLDRNMYELALDNLNQQMNSLDRIRDFDIRKFINDELEEKIVLFLEDYKKNAGNRVAMWDIPVKLGRSERVVSLRVDATLIYQAFLPLYQRTLKKVKECLSAATGVSEINKIILVGGSTKLKLLQEMLQQDFPSADIYCELNPDEAVALGAAVQMDVIRGETGMVVSDVLPQSVGVDCVMTLDNMEIPGRFKRVIAKDTVLPAEASVQLTTIRDNQTILPVAIYQGESFNTDENTYLGTIVLDGVNLQKKGEDDLTLSMRIDANGILSVSLSADGKKTQLVLQNILNPQEKKTESPAEKMIKSLRSLVLANSGISEKDKEEFLGLLSECEEDPKKLPGVRAKIKQAMAEKASKAREELTSNFAVTSSMYSSVQEEDGYDGEDE